MVMQRMSEVVQSKRAAQKEVAGNTMQVWVATVPHDAGTASDSHYSKALRGCQEQEMRRRPMRAS